MFVTLRRGGGGSGLNVIMTLIFRRIVWMCPLMGWSRGGSLPCLPKPVLEQ
jgi:hypothetical protein